MPLYPPLAKKVVYNVQDSPYNALGDGAADDAAAIQSCINACPLGGAIYLPSGTYLVGTVLSLTGGKTLYGAAPSEGSTNGSILTMKNGANLVAVLASTDALGTGASPTCGYPITIHDIEIDANNANNTSGHGILLMNYGSTVRDCAVYNTAQSGVVWTDTNQGGHAITNTCVENRIENCKINNCTQHGIWIQDNGTGALTDGFCLNNDVSVTSQDTISLDRASGWIVQGNHTYSSGMNAITCGACFATRIIDNYIEGFGSSATANYYTGISANLIGDRGTIIRGNSFGGAESVAGTHYTYIGVTGVSTTDPNYVVIEGNSIYGAWKSNPNYPASPQYSQAISISANSAQITAAVAMYALILNNIFSNVGKDGYIDASVTEWTGHIFGPEQIDGALTLKNLLALTPSSSSAPATGGTISTAGIGIARIAPTSAITDVILQAGAQDGQLLLVENNSAFTVTFAASAASHVADGVSSPIAANTARTFEWNATVSQWFGANAASGGGGASIPTEYYIQGSDSAVGTVAALTTNYIYMDPITILVSTTITGAKVYIGTALTTGHCQIGITDTSGTVLIASASTLIPTSSTEYTINLTANYTLPPGTYYFCVWVDNGTDQHVRVSSVANPHTTWRYVVNASGLVVGASVGAFAASGKKVNPIWLVSGGGS